MKTIVQDNLKDHPDTVEQKRIFKGENNSFLPDLLCLLITKWLKMYYPVYLLPMPASPQTPRLVGLAQGLHASSSGYIPCPGLYLDIITNLTYSYTLCTSILQLHSLDQNP